MHLRRPGIAMITTGPTKRKLHTMKLKCKQLAQRRSASKMIAKTKQTRMSTIQKPRSQAPSAQTNGLRTRSPSTEKPQAEAKQSRTRSL